MFLTLVKSSAGPHPRYFRRGWAATAPPGPTVAPEPAAATAATVRAGHWYETPTSLAEHHAALLAYTARKGQRRGPHDLIVAATGRATGRTILTTDVQARFGELPDVNGRIVT